MSVLQLYTFLAFLFGLQKYLYISAIPNFGQENIAKTMSVNCVYNPEFITNLTCNLKPVNWDLSLLDVDCDFRKPLRKPMVHWQLFKYTNQFRPFLLNYTIDWCEVMNRKFKDLYIQMMYKIATKITNIIHKCPPMGHWQARGAYLDLTVLPFAVPKGLFKVVVTFYDGWPYEFVMSVEPIFKVQKRATAKRKTKQTAETSHLKPSRQADEP